VNYRRVTETGICLPERLSPVQLRRIDVFSEPATRENPEKLIPVPDEQFRASFGPLDMGRTRAIGELKTSETKKRACLIFRVQIASSLVLQKSYSGISVLAGSINYKI
jgi:hypothetical protein